MNGSSFHFRPVEAADILANELYKSSSMNSPKDDMFSAPTPPKTSNVLKLKNDHKM